jgi:hypothetical protein
LPAGTGAAGERNNAMDMPIAGPKHAINFQSIKRRLFGQPGKIFERAAWNRFERNRPGGPRTVSAQLSTSFCMRVVRRSSRMCTHPINAINFLLERKLIYFFCRSRAIFYQLIKVY